MKRSAYLIDRTDPAIADLKNALDQSFRPGGAGGQKRYRALLNQCLRDVAADPARIGAIGLEGDVWLYHSRHSRLRVGPAGLRVRAPRHIVAYRVDNAARRVVILRVLHDAMDLPAQIQQAAAKSRNSQSDSS